MELVNEHFVINYIGSSANICQNLQVLPFGSVPLKTYLPDGDIDLTAINWNYPESSFAYYIFSALKSFIYNKDSPFEVKDAQFVDAEVDGRMHALLTEFMLISAATSSFVNAKELVIKLIHYLIAGQACEMFH